MLLADLPDGATGRVAGYAGAAPSYVRRLLAMGLVPGAEVQVVRRAPLGDPVQVAVLGSALSLRAGEASSLLLERA